jgi:hypothetical protein
MEGLKMDCLLEVYNSSLKKSQWFNGTVLGYYPGDVNENFERIDVQTKNGIFYDCHPDCVIHKDKKFTAKDKQNREYKYRFIEIASNSDSYPYNIKLLNLDNNTLTEVEPEWFNQRIIKMISSEIA